jgi:hypothetical protein
MRTRFTSARTASTISDDEWYALTKLAYEFKGERMRPVKAWLTCLLVLAAGFFLVFGLAAYWPEVRDEFFVVVGSRDEGGGYYGAWSGVMGGLQVFEWAAIGCMVYWHHSCHVSSCLRPGRHLVDGTPYRACRRHHPAGMPRRITPFHLAEAARSR